MIRDPLKLINPSSQMLETVFRIHSVKEVVKTQIYRTFIWSQSVFFDCAMCMLRLTLKCLHNHRHHICILSNVYFLYVVLNISLFQLLPSSSFIKFACMCVTTQIFCFDKSREAFFTYFIMYTSPQAACKESNPWAGFW